MVQIVADAELHEKLADLKVPAEVIDATGKVLGEFIPSVPKILTIEEAREMGILPFSDEEIAEMVARAQEDPAGRPLSEILRSLEAL